MTKDEALKLALEALERALSDDKPYIVKSKEAITAIKEVLAQPEPEQYCWMSPEGVIYQASDEDVLCGSTPMYLGTPPQRRWVGLTNGEIDTISSTMRTWNSFDITDVYRHIEAKLKEKNHG